MSIQIACPGCGHMYNMKDEFAGKRVKCTKCATQFTVEAPAMAGAGARAAAAPASKPIGAMAGYQTRKMPTARDMKDEIKPSKFNLPFTLGPDDRYPRVLYWGLLIYFVLDSIFSIPVFLHVLKESPDIDYHGQRLVGWGLAIVIPLGMAVPVILAYPIAALIYGIYKFLMMGIVVTSWLGSSMIGEQVGGTPVWLQAIWHIGGTVLGIWYFMARRD